MAADQVEIIRWGRERARSGPWRGDAGVAQLTPLPDSPPLSVGFVRHCLDQLAASGFARVLTGALGPLEQDGFLAAGFAVQEELHLLSHDLRQLPAPDDDAGLAVRRARPTDRREVLDVDGRAFPPFWRLDEGGLDEALGATPHTRFRVVAGACSDADVRPVAGYAITGRAGRRGFLQRLAVDPGARRLGLGRGLVMDGLRWLRRWHVERAVVNTQIDNHAALALYRSLGFRREPVGLSVLATGLGP